MKSSYEVRQVVAFVCKLMVPVLDYDCVKDLRVTKIAKNN